MRHETLRRFVQPGQLISFVPSRVHDIDRFNNDLCHAEVGII